MSSETEHATPHTHPVMQRFVIYIKDEESLEELVGLARIDTEAEDEGQATERAVRLHTEHTGRDFAAHDVALCAAVRGSGPKTPFRVVPRR
jgi:hypothetical protein